MTFNLNFIFIFILGGGWFFSRFFSKLKLPSVFGMVIFGICCSVLIKDQSTDLIWQIAPFLKSAALIIILLRAGLGISKKSLKKVGIPAILMSFLPCILEGSFLMILFRYLMNFTWETAGLTAFMLSAVSPAVIVPSMLKLQTKTESNAPTLILAGASVDDVFAITLFSVFLGITQNSSVNITKTLLNIPWSIIAGIAAGILTGFLISFIFKKFNKSLRATEKTLIVLVSSLFLYQAGEIYKFAALLGIMVLGFILLEKSEESAHKISSKFSKLWIFAEIILFVLIGFSIDLNSALPVGFKGILIICAGLIFRSAGVILALIPSGLSVNEKIFCVIAYTPKATVQAALGGVALSSGIQGGATILALAVISILFTAPLGLMGINTFGKKLLS